MMTSKKAAFVLSLFFVSSHARTINSSSLRTRLNKFARFMVMPPDTITKANVYEWKGFNPWPVIKSHKQYCTVIKSTNIDEVFPEEYLGKNKEYQTSSEFVKVKLSTIISGQETISPKQYSIFRHGPACPLGQIALPYYHQLPYSPIVMGCKYLLMYWAFNELRSLYRQIAGTQDDLKKLKSKKRTA